MFEILFTIDKQIVRIFAHYVGKTFVALIMYSVYNMMTTEHTLNHVLYNEDTV